MDNTADKIALVTGASSGLGKAMAEYLSNRGYYVFAAARSMDKLEAMRSEKTEPIQLDVTDMSSVSKSVKHIITSKGRLDLLVNSAGYGVYGSIEGVTPEDAKKGFDVNVFGLSQIIQTVLPIMRNQKYGMIINVSSIVGKISLPFLGWYAATKHALEGLTDALRAEVRPFGIKVVLIEPGSINTGFEDVAMRSLEKCNDPEDYKKHKASFTKAVKSSFRSAPDAGVVIKELQKIIGTRNPRARYVAGREGKLFLILRSLISDKMLDFIVSKQ